MACRITRAWYGYPEMSKSDFRRTRMPMGGSDGLGLSLA